MSDDPLPPLTISIVSYNTRADLLRCLASIYDAPPRRPFTVIVADNGSQDGSVAAVRATYPQARVLETGGNLGYGRANNRALLGGDGGPSGAGDEPGGGAGDEPGDGNGCFAILNSDLALRPGSLDACCDYLAAHPEAGVVGGALLRPSGEPQRDWAAGELTPRAVAFEQLFLAQAFPRSPLFGDYFRGAWPRGDTRALPQVCGAFLVIRASLYRRLGGFDPLYFMYAEDTDLCRRVRDAGLSCVYLHTAPATHYHGVSSAGRLRPLMVQEHAVSRCRYLARYDGPRAARAAQRWIVVGSALRVALWSIAGGALRRPAWVEKARSYRAVLRGIRRWRGVVG